MKCEKCGNELTDGSLFCNKCGEKFGLKENNGKPNDYNSSSVVTPSNIKGRKNIKTYIILSFVLLLGFSVGGWYYLHKINIETKEQYEIDLISVTNEMIYVAAEAEEMINNYIKVWGFSIDQGNKAFYISANENEEINLYEFINTGKKGTLVLNTDEAIRVVFNKYMKEGKISEIAIIKNNVAERVKQLNNPIDEYKVMYEIVIQMYSIINEFISMAEEPSGSYLSYTTKKSDLIDEIIKKKKEFDVRLPN